MPAGGLAAEGSSRNCDALTSRLGAVRAWRSVLVVAVGVEVVVVVVGLVGPPPTLSVPPSGGATCRSRCGGSPPPRALGCCQVAIAPVRPSPKSPKSTLSISQMSHFLRLWWVEVGVSGGKRESVSVSGAAVRPTWRGRAAVSRSRVLGGRGTSASAPPAWLGRAPGAVGACSSAVTHRGRAWGGSGGPGCGRRASVARRGGRGGGAVPAGTLALVARALGGSRRNGGRRSVCCGRGMR